jgi:hypothetical protein
VAGAATTLTMTVTDSLPFGLIVRRRLAKWRTWRAALEHHP